MSKSRDRDKKVALACGLGVLVIVGLIVLSWEGLRDWYVGYRFIWLPEGAVPTSHAHQRINASGVVAVDLSHGPEGRRAGRWSLATREVFPLDVPLVSGEISMVFAINDAGDMVGTVTGDAEALGFHPSRPFLWTKHAGLRDLATLGGDDTVATAINERGQVVGWSTFTLKVGNSSRITSRAFLWSADSGIADLGSLTPGKDSHATAINEAGWVVGYADAADGSRHPFVWNPEMGMYDPGMPPGFTGGYARDINEKGEALVVFRSEKLSMPFLWSERDGFLKLPVPPGFDSVQGAALNNRGTVLLRVYSSDPSRGYIGYLIVNGILKELPGAPGAESTSYYGLNDKGWLVGAAQTKEGGPWRGFVALPVR